MKHVKTNKTLLALLVILTCSQINADWSNSWSLYLFAGASLGALTCGAILFATRKNNNQVNLKSFISDDGLLPSPDPYDNNDTYLKLRKLYNQSRKNLAESILNNKQHINPLNISDLHISYEHCYKTKLQQNGAPGISNRLCKQMMIDQKNIGDLKKLWQDWKELKKNKNIMSGKTFKHQHQHLVKRYKKLPHWQIRYLHEVMKTNYERPTLDETSPENTNIKNQPTGTVGDKSNEASTKKPNDKKKTDHKKPNKKENYFFDEDWFFVLN